MFCLTIDGPPRPDALAVLERFREMGCLTAVIPVPGTLDAVLVVVGTTPALRAAVEAHRGKVPGSWRPLPDANYKPAKTRHKAAKPKLPPACNTQPPHAQCAHPQAWKKKD